MNPDKWPSISYSDNLELINEIADNLFDKGSFEGKFAALLMYHLGEVICQHLIDDCFFFIQLSIHPATIQRKSQENRMLGQYIKELRESIDFPEKDVFLDSISRFNTFRNETVHGMKKANIAELNSKLENVKKYFNKIYVLYDEIQDNFRVDFHGFKKDVFIDYIDEDEDNSD